MANLVAIVAARHALDLIEPALRVLVVEGDCAGAREARLQTVVAVGALRSKLATGLVVRGCAARPSF